ncbi:MAG TPA: ATP-binding protein [Anaeromyxobacteraceae bacterium]|nr:ATP-binding protein [Anaeromyxobacteraceae bacterium]
MPACVDPPGAWVAECLERERREGIAAALCAGLLIPAWVPLDMLMEPARARQFAVLRLVGAAFSVAAFASLRRARTRAAVRATNAAHFVMTGLCVAVMLPQVEHFQAYVVGYSLFLWGAGALFTWPVWLAAGTALAHLSLLSLLILAAPARPHLDDLLSGGFYLVTTAAMVLGFVGARRRTLRRAFQASMELAQRHRELVTALESLRDTQARLVASEKQSALGRLLAGLSHEINNPVNVLQNNLDPVREHVGALVELARHVEGARPGELPALQARCRELDLAFVAEDLADATGIMRSAVERIRQVHRDLRAFIRGGEPESVVSDLNEGLQATLALIGRRLPAGIRIDADLGRLRPVRMQPGQLNQVWHNLVQNAVDAVGAGGVITVRSREIGSEVEVSVADTGPGVPAEVLPRLFEPFFTTKGVGVGTGLGLATCYQIVERHAGRIAVDPTCEAGARFVVRLPAA